MNNAEQIGEILEWLGFVPYHMNEHFEKTGFGQSFQKWSKDHVEVFRKASDRWGGYKRTNTGWSDIYQGKATPSLIRLILEENGFVEKQETFREELADLMERHDVTLGIELENGEYACGPAQVTFSFFSTKEDFDPGKEFVFTDHAEITPDMLRGKEEEK